MKTNIELQQDVLDELKWNPMLNAAEIGVIVKDGVVTLTGKVDSYTKKIAAEKTTKNVAGVKAVAIDIEVKLGYDKPDDADIAKAAVNALKWHSSIPEDKVKIEVDNGWVTLEGQVNWPFQKDSAENCIENLTGVRGISNLITIKPKTDKLIKDNILKAFQRNAALEAAKITVETIGDKVILKGKVHSWSERHEAEKAAWNAPGVVEVEDDLLIAYN
jgi:osmotically-inducible protein OsmY